MSRNLQHTKYAYSKSIFLKLHLFGKLPKLCPKDSILHVYFLHATATNHLNSTYTYILDKRTFTNCFAKRLVCPRLLLYIHQILSSSFVSLQGCIQEKLYKTIFITNNYSSRLGSIPLNGAFYFANLFIYYSNLFMTFKFKHNFLRLHI